MNQNTLINKQNEIKNMNISEYDKKILLDFYNNQYNNQIKQYEMNNIFNFKPIFPEMKPIQGFNNYNVTSYNFSKKINPDGTYTIYEQNKINNNGVVDSKINHYRIDSNGNKHYLL